jgi:sugar phosphate isomerase/epimerase
MLQGRYPLPFIKFVETGHFQLKALNYKSMKKLSRRIFLKNSALALGSAVIAPHFSSGTGIIPVPGKVKMPLGFQVWTLRDKLVKDFPGTLKMMAGLGYKTVEMCSPPGYESNGFGPLMKLKASEMKQIINDAGLSCLSSHYGMGELREHLEERIEFALELGQKQMILASFGLPQGASLSDWLKAADELNEIGLKARKAGIRMGFHNHNTEFAQLGGKLIYDELMNRFDPECIKMQFQVAVIELGFKASAYFTKYPGRFISAHLADWSPELKKGVPLGQGIVDWKEFFKAAKTGGVKNIFVEMDPSTFEESAKYVNNFKL